MRSRAGAEIGRCQSMQIVERLIGDWPVNTIINGPCLRALWYFVLCFTIDYRELMTASTFTILVNERDIMRHVKGLRYERALKSL